MVGPAIGFWDCVDGTFITPFSSTVGVEGDSMEIGIRVSS